jgi:hypothetical protein
MWHQTRGLRRHWHRHRNFRGAKFQIYNQTVLIKKKNEKKIAIEV